MERLSPTPPLEVASLPPPPAKPGTEISPNGRRHVPDSAAVSPSPSAPLIELQPTFKLSIYEVDLLITIRAAFDTRLEKLERLHHRLSRRTSTPEVAPSIPPASAFPLPKLTTRPRENALLPGTLRFLDRLAHVPLLPAPPAFEEVFKPFEPMFHTVFFRKYPWYIREDAKQEALLRLWQDWKRDLTLLDQTRAYVTQAALWGASPWRKKRAKIDANEAPMPKHERYLSGGKQAPTPDTAWVQRIDLTYDVELAIRQVKARLKEHPDSSGMERALEDFLNGISIAAGRKSSGLTWRVYGEYRKMVVAMLREALADYHSTAKKCGGEIAVDCPSQVIYEHQAKNGVRPNIKAERGIKQSTINSTPRVTGNQRNEPANIG